MESVKRVAILGPNTEISTSPVAAAAAAGVGIVAGGGAFYLLSRAGASLGLAALGGAVLGGIGAFAVVARHREVEEPFEDDPGREAMAVPASGPANAARIAAYLEEHLGREITGYVSGIEPEDIEIVGRWAAGDAEPEPLAFRRLETAYEAIRRILPFYDGRTAQSWFFGSWMKGKAPAHVLRYGSDSGIWEQVVNAAEEFVEHTR